MASTFLTRIAAGALPAAVAAKAATTTIPIVFSIGVDPVAFGLVASLNRPGGNMTGVTNLNLELGSKQLEVLRELLPAATSMAALVNPTNPNSDAHSSDLQAAARKLGIELYILPREQRARFRRRLHQPGPDARRRARDRLRSVLREPQQAARRSDRSSRGARDLSVSRVCRRRRLAELRQQHYGRVPSGRRLYRAH